MNRRDFLGSASLTLAAATSPRILALDQRSASVRPAGSNSLEAFDYRGVRLLPGMFEQRVHATRELYFNLSSDDILKGFRRRAGLPSPGNDMAGWAKHDSSATFGQWISGMARLSCALNDEPLREKAVYLTREWERTLPPDGNCRMGTYAFEKMSCGLLDVALYAGYDQALLTQKRITDWAMRNFDRSRSPATPLDRDGRRPHGTLEWYTLPENSYRAYLATGDPVFRDFADLWKYDSYWNKFADSANPAGVAYLHSYSHVNTFCGAAMAYAVIGDERSLRILRNAYDFVMDTQAYATGGYGPGEWSVPSDGTLGRAIELRSDTAEIPCGSWAGFKLSRYLLGYTGEARYGEWIETLLYNGIGAALPVTPDGHTFYYADYQLGSANKLYHWDQWPCCSGTYIQTVADFHNVIYFRSLKGLYVNLLVPSEVTWQQAGHTVMVRQETTFPESNDSRLTLHLERPLRFGIHLRVPSWAAKMIFAVNGEPLTVPVQPSQWAKIEREWAGGDVLTVTLEMPIYSVPVDRQHPDRAAIKYGPVLLAQDAIFTYPLALDHDHPDLAGRFSRTSPSLQFAVSDLTHHEQRTGNFRPFYAVEERTPYRIYFDMYAPRFL